MPEPAALPRLYAILDTAASTARDLLPDVLLQVWLDAGIRLVQLRAKDWTLGPTLRLAERAVRMCEPYSARLVINDRADVAVLAGAAGVHVGQDDLGPRATREIVGPSAWIGLSTHDDAQVAAAVREPITYLAVGPVYPTRSKQNPDDVVGLAGVKRAVAVARPRGLPVVAIGGITAEEAPGVIEAGAASIAVISDLLDPDPSSRAAVWVRLLQ